MIITTKRLLRDAGACENRYLLLCAWTPADDDAPIPLVDILDQQGLDDTLWALRAMRVDTDGTAVARYFARHCAASVLHLWKCSVPPVVLEYLRSGAEGLRAAARDASWDASWDAAGAAARAAARAAAGAAARAAAGAAARDASWAAAGDAAWEASRAAQIACLRRLLTEGVPADGIVEIPQRRTR